VARPRLALCDVGLGNLCSVARALERVGAEVVPTTDPDVVRRADRVVVPGQGAFRDCMDALAGPLGEAVLEAIRAGTPYLGICLGLQVLFEESDEHGRRAGLGLFAGRVRRFPAEWRAPDGRRLKVPHMGWNRVEVVRPAPLLAALPPDPWFYFVHSYYPEPADRGLVVAESEYGGRFTVAVQRDNVFACQFHPEKSQATGLALLQAFVGP
jgi:imidazole glycerol-phosphate synthase subunit HisH